MGSEIMDSIHHGNYSLYTTPADILGFTEMDTGMDTGKDIGMNNTHHGIFTGKTTQAEMLGYTYTQHYRLYMDFKDCWQS